MSKFDCKKAGFTDIEPDTSIEHDHSLLLGDVPESKK